MLVINKYLFSPHRQSLCPPGPHRLQPNTSALVFKLRTFPAAEAPGYIPKSGLLVPLQEPLPLWHPQELGRYPHHSIKFTAASRGRAARPNTDHQNYNAECLLVNLFYDY